MALNDYIDWTGLSGKTYRYWFVSSPTGAGLKAVAGNYAFVRVLADGRFAPEYFGETNNFKSRIPSHEVWEEAKRLGATHVMGHTTPAGEQARLDEERDLIEYWNPQLNTQHRTTG